MTENDYIAEYVKEKMPEITHTFDFAMWKFVRHLKNIAEAFSKVFKKGDEDDQECGYRSDVCEGEDGEGEEDTYSEWSGWNSETDEI